VELWQTLMLVARFNPDACASRLTFGYNTGLYELSLVCSSEVGSDL
jgi:hypothetical protein